MSDSKSPALVYPRLQLAYFIQFAVWGSYAFALSMFFGKFMTPAQVGWIVAAIPIGAIFAPMIVGPIADRFFPAQYVLAALHAVCCGLLFFVAKSIGVDAAGNYTAEFWPVMISMLLLGIFYMPSIALINTIVFKHTPDSNKTPFIFIFGTLGWIIVVLTVQAFFGGGNTPGFLKVAAYCCAFMTIYSLTLPNTPPNKDAKTGDVFGLKAWGLLGEPRFAVFALSILVAGTAACGLYFMVCGQLINQRAYPGGLALTTLNQFSELFFMAALPFFAKRIGLKNVLLLGMLAWAARYFFFMPWAFTFTFVALLLHGLCYAFLYNAAYMYADKIAPEDIKASVQSLCALILLGVSQVAGSVLAGHLMEANPPALANAPKWTDPAAVNSVWNCLDLSQYVQKKVEPAADAPKAFDLNDITNGEKSITWDMITKYYAGAEAAPAEAAPAEETPAAEAPAAEEAEAAPATGADAEAAAEAAPAEEAAEAKAEEVLAEENPVAAVEEAVEGAKAEEAPAVDPTKAPSMDELAEILKKAQAAATGAEVKANEEINLTLQQYLEAQTNNWKKIFMVPALMALFAFVFFMLFGKNPEAKAEA